MSGHDIVAQWLIKVAEDLQSADVLLSVGLTDNSCYFSQQAGEKALKFSFAKFIERAACRGGLQAARSYKNTKKCEKILLLYTGGLQATPTGCAHRTRDDVIRQN